jgi:hypothetical protein
MAMLPGGHRATPWRTFVQAHWPALVAADFFTTEVWTTRGLVTYYTAFVIELQSRRVQILGSTPYPDEAFVIQCLRSVTNESDALLQRGKILVCDRDPKWSESHLRRILREFVAPYHRERNHQGLANELIDGPPAERRSGAVRRRQRVGGILSYYYRSAA